jgi:hypothetical protein
LKNKIKSYLENNAISVQTAQGTTYYYGNFIGEFFFKKYYGREPPLRSLETL